MVETLTIIATIIAGISIPLLLASLSSRKRKDQEMSDKIEEISKSKADKSYVDKEFEKVQTTMRDNAVKDAEIHKNIYKFMESIDSKLDILIKEK